MFGYFSQTTASSCFFSVCLPGICLGAAHSPGQPVPGICCIFHLPALRKVLAQLKAGQEFPPPRDNLYDRFMSGPVNPVFYRFFVKAEAFRATEACIGCGKCVELCPLNNIHLESGKPVWGKDCTHCMACICYCPKEAIEYGKKSRGKPRYHFEALEKKQDV